MRYLGYKKYLALVLGLGFLSPSFSDEEPFICGFDSQAEYSGGGQDTTLPRIRVYQGILKAVVFRIEFSDVPYSSLNITEAKIVANNNIINNAYKEMSRNLFSWELTLWSRVLKMPGTRASYAGNFSALRSDITTAVNATGLKRGTDYAVYNTTFPKVDGLGWSGLSSGGTSGQNYMNGSYGTGVTTHEMGHTVGLAHAHAIKSIVNDDMWGTPGNNNQHEEYGHPFDVMGRGGTNGHFNIAYKYRDGWTDGRDVEVLLVMKSGVYRVYAHDNPTHKGRLIGMRVPSDDSRYGYWFEYRTNTSANRKGASVMFDGWDGPSSRANTWYLDLTTATSSRTDGVMAPNMGFTDKYGKSRFKTLGVSGTTGVDAWVDIEINMTGTRIDPRLNTNRKLVQLNENTEVYNLSGRRVTRGLHTMQTLILKNGKNISPKLYLQAE